MFYNNYRSTRAALKEEERRKLTRKNMINKERLMNLQKRKKLKELLITKFSEKYKMNYPDQLIENEISRFVQKEKLNDVDLQRLDNKIKRMLRNSSAKNILKTNLTKNLQQPKSEEEIINENKESYPIIPQDNLIETQNKKNEEILLPQVQLNSTINQNNDKTLNHSQSTKNINYNNNNIYSNYNIPKYYFNRTFYKPQVYKKPEEELRELEEELKREEEEYKPKGPRLDFSKEGNEWNAINKYNKKLYDEQIREERMKDNEMKRRTKEDLDNQVKQKLKREYEEVLKEKESDKIFQEHLKHIDELEKEKQEALRKQILREKKNRDAQIKDEYTRKRIEQLKQRKFERNLIKNIKEEMEKEKQAAIQKKIKENEALKKVIRENELYKEKQKELLQKEKEEDIESYKEMERNELKKDLERKRYFDNIRRFANKYDENETAKILNQMKKDQKDEDEKVYQLMMEKNRQEEEKEKKDKIKRKEDKIAMRKFLDMQIEEKKKDMELEKAINDEQARIWNMDCKKYSEDEKRINKIIRDMNKRNLDSIMEQMKKRKGKKNQSMSEVEYAINRETLEKAKAEMDSEKNN